MVLGLWAYPLRGLRLALGLLAYGLGIELAQAATGWRFGEVADLLADAVGVAVGWVVSMAVMKVLAWRIKRQAADPEV
jgi:VanZ family protein